MESLWVRGRLMRGTDGNQVETNPVGLAEVSSGDTLVTSEMRIQDILQFDPTLGL